MATTSDSNVLRAGRAAPADLPAEDAFTRRVEEGAKREGRSGLSRVRTRLFGYDRLEGMAVGAFHYGVDTADRMPPDKAAEALSRIHAAHGISTSMETTMYMHDQAMMVCYAFNGASQLGPYERAGYRIGTAGGAISDFEYGTVVTVLGVDLRRFFRAYANEVVDACKDLYTNFNIQDPDMVELRAQMVSLADKRGVSRYPWLIPDCAEAATNLSPGELAAVMSSKQSVIGATTNSVDARNLAKPIRSLDGYDSSNNQSVNNANDIHAPGQYYA